MERIRDEEDKSKLKGKIFWAKTAPDAVCILKSWVWYISFFFVRVKIYTGVPPYPQVIRSKTYRGYVKLRIVPNAIYKTWYSCNKHKYGKV
jgi:hypothetical protein